MITFQRRRMGVGCLELVGGRVRTLACIVGGANAESVNAILDQLRDFVRHAGTVVNRLESEIKIVFWPVSCNLNIQFAAIV